EGELPGIFSKMHPVNQTPVGAYVLTGIISTLVLLVYGFMAGSNEDLFWTLFAFSSIVFLMPYLAMFPAFLKLRLTEPHIKRPYQLPGGKVVAWILAIICELFIVQALVFFIWVPGTEIDWSYATPVLLGVLLTIVVGEVMLWASKRK
ncbi:MAG: amino acid permease, partial [Anaerolineae bacterium]|nr:amino acid permease [Anaerolineae bacterium]